MDTKELRSAAIHLFRGIDCPEFQVALEKKCYDEIIATAPPEAWERFWRSRLSNSWIIAYHVLIAPSSANLTADQLDQLITTVAKDIWGAHNLLINRPGLTHPQVARLVASAARESRVSYSLLTHPDRPTLSADQLDQLITTVAGTDILSRRLLSNPTPQQLTADQVDRLVESVAKNAWESCDLLTTTPGVKLTPDQIGKLVKAVTHNSAASHALLADPHRPPLTEGELAALRRVRRPINRFTNARYVA